MARWLAAAGYVRRRKPVRKGRALPVNGARACRCNQIWTADLKGWFCTLKGERIEPLTVRDLHSKYVLAATPASTAEHQVRRIFRRLFQRYGLPRVIRTDHGVPFCGLGPYRLTKLSLWWHRLGIKVQFVRRHEGINNNSHEQMHRVLQAEVAATPQPNFRQQCRALAAWQRRYNYRRGHAALAMRTPAECYRRSRRKLPRLHKPSYPSHWLVRYVQHGGEIVLRRRRFGIGRAFAKLPVGLHPRRDGTYRVYFERLLLGILDLTRGLLHQAPERRGG
jgi:transposase InsO family protein